MKRKHDFFIKLLKSIFTILFIVGVFTLLAKNFMKPLTEADVEQCTLIASDIYFNQKDVANYDVPTNYTVWIDDKKITVKPTNWKYGYVECTVENDKIKSVFENKTDTYFILCGALTVIAYAAFFGFVLLFSRIYHIVCDSLTKKTNAKS